MDVELELAKGLLHRHPVEAARALEVLSPSAVAELLAVCDLELGAEAFARMAPAAARAAVDELPPTRAAALLHELPLDVSARLLRSMGEEPRAAILRELPGRTSRALVSLLRFPERTAGALMDPEVLALPQEMSVREALESIRRAADHAHYNVYVIDRDHVLVGVINLRELLLARGGDPLSSCMQHPVRSLSARADPHRIVSDRGWREVHSLPVVDAAGVYLGAIRYRTLRRLEAELQQPRTSQNTTAHALGDLFRAGAIGLVDALAGSPDGGEDA